MTSEEWADWLDATPADRYRYSGDMFRGLVADLAAAEERAEKWETAASGYIISNNALAAKLEESRQQYAVLDGERKRLLLQDGAARLEALKPYLRHKAPCAMQRIRTFVETDDEFTCTCGLDKLLEGRK